MTTKDQSQQQLPTPEEMDVCFQAALELARRECIKGNPFPFIELQWPNLILPDDERQYFETNLRLDVAQVDALKHVFSPSHRELFMKGCTKYGKGFSAGLAINIWFDVFPDSKIILTGPDHDHVKGGLFAQVVSLRKQMVKPMYGEILTDQVIDRDNVQHFIVIANPKSGEGFSGMHSEHTLFVFDEATACQELYYQMARKQSRFIMCLSNPRTLGGWFRRAFGDHNPNECKSIPAPEGMRRLVTASGSQTVNVRNKRLASPFAPYGGMDIDGFHFDQGEQIPDRLFAKVKALIPAQIDYTRYLSIMAEPDENHRNVYGEGFFPTQDTEVQVIMPEWITIAANAWTPDIEVFAFGVDVAFEEHGDNTELAVGGPKGCLAIHERPGANPIVTANWIVEIIAKTYHIDLTDGSFPIAVDMTGGYGNGVYSLLVERGVRAIPIHSSKRSKKPERYMNKRAELWGELARRMDPRGEYTDRPWAIPDDKMLFEDIAAQEKIIASDGVKFQLLPKSKPNPSYNGRTVAEKLNGRSPDRGDALTLLWAAVSSDECVDDYSVRSLVTTIASDEPTKEKIVAGWSDTREKTDDEREMEWQIKRLCRQMDEQDDFSMLSA